MLVQLTLLGVSFVRRTAPGLFFLNFIQPDLQLLPWSLLDPQAAHRWSVGGCRGVLAVVVIFFLGGGGGDAPDVGPGDAGLALGLLDGGRSDVASQFYGRKRALSSPPLLDKSDYKTNKLFSPPDHRSDLDQDAASILIERRIEKFFDPPSLCTF